MGILNVNILIVTVAYRRLPLLLMFKFGELCYRSSGSSKDGLNHRLENYCYRENETTDFWLTAMPNTQIDTGDQAATFFVPSLLINLPYILSAIRLPIFSHALNRLSQRRSNQRQEVMELTAFKQYGCLPSFDFDEFKGPFDIWLKKWNVFLSLSTISLTLLEEYRCNVCLS
ncbi:hypothetical protein T4B_14717 [Trichinella pseudospiralis]|uniref:Uncharacterized protein n=2 Tax=Trichinella pseudospiralis TaxID=6337 RepID=A0A0V1H026_TRIPS|nr:hypothetical protein T4B_14717 [Trichinella pseudospiralis]KRZ21714.1 hypothetical protein T4C_10291 [Trichinella pseudospiralis]